MAPRRIYYSSLPSVLCKERYSKCNRSYRLYSYKNRKPNVQNVRDYCNRKKYFSVNLQAVVDANMKFTNIYCGQPGSLHDARVLKKFLLYNSANEHREVIFPNGKFIIGDSAYY